jgi:hypothetical protein
VASESFASIPVKFIFTFILHPHLLAHNRIVAVSKIRSLLQRRQRAYVSLLIDGRRALMGSIWSMMRRYAFKFVEVAVICSIFHNK